MNNKEILQTYNERLETNNTSLTDILETVKSLSDATTIPKDMPELSNMIATLMQGMIEYQMTEYVNNYPKFTEEPVTLYTPSEECKNYFIRCSVNRNSAFDVYWYNSCSFIMDGTKTAIYTYAYQTPSILVSTNGEIKFGSNYAYGNFGTKYYKASSTFATLEEAIEAMKSPETTYTSGTNNYFAKYGAKVIAATNIPVINSMSVKEMVMETNPQVMKISANETIAVIPTE